MIKLDEANLRSLLNSKKNVIERFPIPLEGFFAATAFLFSLLTIGKGESNQTYNPVMVATFWIFLAIYIALLAVRSIRGIKTRCTVETLYNDILNLGKERDYALIAIRSTGLPHPNSFILKYDVRWKCFLFPAISIEDELSKADESFKPIEDRIVEYLATHFDLHVEKKAVEFLGIKEQTMFYVPDQVEKTYQHHYYKVDIAECEGILKRKNFKGGGEKFRWFTIPQMHRNKRIKELNIKTVEAVRLYLNL